MITAKFDADYEAWRNSKIPKAEARADAHHPSPSADATERELDAWARAWTAAFHGAMEQLTNDPFAGEVN